METISPAALDEILQKYYSEVTKQDGTDYEPDSLIRSSKRPWNGTCPSKNIPTAW